MKRYILGFIVVSFLMTGCSQNKIDLPVTLNIPHFNTQKVNFEVGEQSKMVTISESLTTKLHNVLFPVNLRIDFTASPPLYINAKGEELGECYLGGEGYINLPNHSLIKDTEDITTPLGRGKLFLLERSYSAASEDDTVWYEIYIIVPIKDTKYSYCTWLKVEKSVEDTKNTLIQIINQL
ncbi:hypothetical protein GJ688_05040 [Heliobacillus mobilis]|uniref:Lipoprotein n=1 Tax=Heliobacterium mobile TaxID=28064 RepID=A0A6I3SHJ8_HELMO|nr:hypothetical protein [Heliobacterium mobile]MTV48349.1 hypothetical protein [Heliobacterium mobile]